MTRDLDGGQISLETREVTREAITILGYLPTRPVIILNVATQRPTSSSKILIGPSTKVEHHTLRAAWPNASLSTFNFK